MARCDIFQKYYPARELYDIRILKALINFSIWKHPLSRSASIPMTSGWSNRKGRRWSKIMRLLTHAMIYRLGPRKSSSWEIKISSRDSWRGFWVTGVHVGHAKCLEICGNVNVNCMKLTCTPLDSYVIGRERG